MIADFVIGAEGAKTPEDAIGLAGLKEGEQYVFSASGQRAWTLRPDETAREEIHLVRLRRGWVLHIREACESTDHEGRLNPS